MVGVIQRYAERELLLILKIDFNNVKYILQSTMEVMEDKEVAFLQLLGASSHLRGADPQQQLQQSWKSSWQPAAAD